ncbi:hypothetical protein ISN45_At03g031040 [Arabidopsis thaliana x Arabidopsis arenosa]|uniref:Uncharacterized protein n=2 Tax=Arabidopsis TaxID=3701 RepID=A0A8T2FDD4_ARASU|nr:hypothetical protein ISN45_At03g031040 [Arabidopsis thaliana x Arabidopsis arenosa]KAG7632964.1 hypothetical protein ISN44_As03g030560 [Arabidopsis suecica]
MSTPPLSISTTSVSTPILWSSQRNRRIITIGGSVES